MTILHWNKVARARDPKAHEAMYGHDGGPPGGFVPNMSAEDEQRWKAKLVNQHTAHPQVEIRKTMPGANLLLIVGLNGYRYKHLTPDSTKDANVHFSVNGSMQLTFDDLNQIHQAVEEAKAVLTALPIPEVPRKPRSSERNKSID